MARRRRGRTPGRRTPPARPPRHGSTARRRGRATRSRSPPTAAGLLLKRCAAPSAPRAMTHISSRPTALPARRVTACESARIPRARRPSRRRRGFPYPASALSPRADGPRPGRVVISEAELRARITALGGAIARDYAGQTPVLVGVLQGAFLFMADLIRATPIDLTTDFIGLSSYGSGTKSSGHVRLVSDLSMSIADRDDLIVEDIVDTGLTLAYLKRNLEARHPRSVRVCVLADKTERREVEVAVDYVGFTVPNVYVVGYGFDYSGVFRNLPYVAVLEGA